MYGGIGAVWGNLHLHLTPTPTPLPLLLSPASTPPVRRPRQRPLPNQRTRRTSATRILQPAPSAARPNVFCFGSRAQRCRGHLTGGEEAGDRRRLGGASPPTSPTSDLQRGVWGNFPRYNPEIVSRQTGKGSREAPPFAPASCLHPSCKTPAAAAPPRGG